MSREKADAVIGSLSLGYQTTPHVRGGEGLLSDTVQSAGIARASDRRLHLRHPASFSCVQLDDDNGGIILDVSESGLSAHVVRSLRDDQFSQIRFQLQQSRNWIENRARLIWANGSKTTVGVKFEDLSSENRILLKHWISSLADPEVTVTKCGLSENAASAKSAIFGAEPAAVFSSPVPETRKQSTQSPGRPSYSVAASFAATASRSNIAASAQKSTRTSLETKVRVPRIPERRPEATQPSAIDSRRASLWLPVILSASLLLALGAFGFSRHPRGRLVAGDNLENIAANSDTSLPATVPESQASLAPQQEAFPISVISKSVPGFFLQAGAMKDQGNAYALARSLQQKGFPAFLLKETESLFYKVLVGPYTNIEVTSMLRVRLQEQGFHTIVTHASSY